MPTQIKVCTKFFAILREAAQRSEDSLMLKENSTVNDFLIKLGSKYGKKFSTLIFDDSGELRETFVTLVNGQAVNGVAISSVKLNDDDLVVLLPPINGG